MKMLSLNRHSDAMNHDSEAFQKVDLESDSTL